jgi:hypothetical protein
MPIISGGKKKQFKVPGSKFKVKRKICRDTPRFDLGARKGP